MASVTLTLDPELKSEMKELTWVNWSELTRESFSEKLRRAKAFEKFDEILKDSRMTDKLASKLADELKKRVAKRHGL